MPRRYTEQWDEKTKQAYVEAVMHAVMESAKQVRYDASEVNKEHPGVSGSAGGGAYRREEKPDTPHL